MDHGTESHEPTTGLPGRGYLLAVALLCLPKFAAIVLLLFTQTVKDLGKGFNEMAAALFLLVYLFGGFSSAFLTPAALIVGAIAVFKRSVDGSVKRWIAVLLIADISCALYILGHSIAR